MPKKSWTVQLEDGMHTVELDKRWASGKRVIRVDGQIVFESKLAWMNTGNDDEFRVGLHECVLHSRTNVFTGSYDLSIDGRSVVTGQPMTKLQPMPKWVWIFIVACGIIPILTLGGATASHARHACEGPMGRRHYACSLGAADRLCGDAHRRAHFTDTGSA
jgi:hypothetical protein